MRKGLFSEATPFTQLILTAFAMIACNLLLSFIGLLLAPLFLDISLLDILNMTQSGTLTKNLDLMRYLQVIQGISLFIIPALFLGYLFSGNVAGYFGFCRTASAESFGLVFLIMLTAIPFINLLASLNEMIVFPESLSWLEEKLRSAENTAAETTKLFLEVNTVGGMFFNIFMMAILAALSEELIFRGVVQKILIRWTGSIHAGIIIAGFFFSMMHLQFYGFFPRWLLGVMFGYLLVWTGSIWVPVFAHFVNNAMIVVATFLINKGVLPEKASDFGADLGAIPVTVVTTAICVCLLRRLFKISKAVPQNQNTIPAVEPENNDRDDPAKIPD